MAEDTNNNEQQAKESKPKEPKKAQAKTAAAKDNANDKGDSGSKAKGTGTETIRVRLADNKLMWSTPSKSIELNAFKQQIDAEVTKSDDDFKYVNKALELGILEVVKEGEEVPKFMSKELTYGKVQEDEMAKAKTHYNTEEYLNMLQDDVIKKVKAVDDPKLLIRLIQAERKGQNKEKVPREIVLSAMKNKLKAINVNGVYDIDIGDI